MYVIAYKYSNFDSFMSLISVWIEKNNEVVVQV